MKSSKNNKNFLLSQNAAEQFQRATTLSASRGEMAPNTFNISIHQLKREVDSYKQRQQEIVSFDQVSAEIVFRN